MPINTLNNLQRFTNRVINNINTGKYVLDHARLTFGELMVKTPLLFGFARANWFFSIGKPGNRLEEENNKFGNINYAGIPSVLSPDQPLFLFNNIHYIGDLERGNSKQAPLGFLKQSIDASNINWRAKYAYSR